MVVLHGSKHQGDDNSTVAVLRGSHVHDRDRGHGNHDRDDCGHDDRVHGNRVLDSRVLEIHRGMSVHKNRAHPSYRVLVRRRLLRLRKELEETLKVTSCDLPLEAATKKILANKNAITDFILITIKTN